MARQVPESDTLLLTMCKVLSVDPGKVLDWRAYDDRVVVCVDDGRKLVASR